MTPDLADGCVCRAELQALAHLVNLHMRVLLVRRGWSAQEQLFCLLRILLLVAAAKAHQIPSICCDLQLCVRINPDKHKHLW